MADMRFLAMIVAASIAMTVSSSVEAKSQKTVVGTWLVRQVGAPFPMHMYVFGADGTVHQSNPDAGNAGTSDSDGKGIWIARDGKIVGKWVELSADRATHKYVGRGELSFELVLAGDDLMGSSSFVGFDASGKQTVGPLSVPFEGTRVQVPVSIGR